MDESQKQQVKVRGVALATAGFATALGLMLVMSRLGLSGLDIEQWLYACLVTLTVQCLLLLLVLTGWDLRIPGDSHFLYTPLFCAMLLLALYMFLAPELRFVILLGWFVALLFMAGLGGFHAVVVLSGIMTLGYFAIGLVLAGTGYPLSVTYEAAVAVSAFVISIYAGVVFERLRGERREMRELRRDLAAMALTDPLTQLPNRRRFQQVLESELDRVRRYGGRCVVAMVDVDHFKHYNDSVGHMAGDAALREVADVMRREIRLHDMVARIGGEEFALIMINAGKEEAYPVLERLRLAVEEHPFRSRDIQPTGRVTVSAGIASFPEDGTVSHDLLKQADDALYRAKRSGRNRICFAGASHLDQPA